MGFRNLLFLGFSCAHRSLTYLLREYLVPLSHFYPIRISASSQKAMTLPASMKYLSPHGLQSVRFMKCFQCEASACVGASSRWGRRLGLGPRVCMEHLMNITYYNNIDTLLVPVLCTSLHEFWVALRWVCK